MSRRGALARLVPEFVKAQGRKDREDLAALLDEVSRFVRAHPDVRITPPWKTAGGRLWEVSVGGATTSYQNPEFMLTVLAERFGYTDD